MQPSWVIVETKPGCEDIAERGLRLAGYRSYLPRYRCHVYPHGRGRNRNPVTVLRPIFPRLVLAQDWRGWPSIPISSVLGLMSLQPGSPAGLSDSDVALIMDRERNREFDLTRELSIGDAVEIDVFDTGISGVLEALSGDGKAVVSAMLFGRTVRAEVDVRNIRRSASP